MTRSRTLTEDDLRRGGRRTCGLERRRSRPCAKPRATAPQRVDADIASARASGVRFTPTFFINGRRYDGPWDESVVHRRDAGLAGPSGAHGGARISRAGRRPPACMLLLATLLAVVVDQHAVGAGVRRRSGTRSVGLSLGDAAFRMSLLHWVNDALLTVFFLVVGLEIKREFTVGHLASRRAAPPCPSPRPSAAWSCPRSLYAADRLAGGVARIGWGVPMATDTAFAVALIVMMGAPRAGGAAHLPDRRRHRRRHRRHRRGGHCFYSDAADISAGPGRRAAVVRLCSRMLQPLARVYRVAPYAARSAWCCGSSSMPVDCTPRSAGVLLAALHPDAPAAEPQTRWCAGEPHLSRPKRSHGGE